MIRSLDDVLSGVAQTISDMVNQNVNRLAKQMLEEMKFLHTNTCWSCGCKFMGDICPNCLVTFEVKA